MVQGEKLLLPLREGSAALPVARTGEPVGAALALGTKGEAENKPEEVPPRSVGVAALPLAVPPGALEPLTAAGETVPPAPLLPVGSPLLDATTEELTTLEPLAPKAPLPVALLLAVPPPRAPPKEALALPLYDAGSPEAVTKDVGVPPALLRDTAAEEDCEALAEEEPRLLPLRGAVDVEDSELAKLKEAKPDRVAEGEVDAEAQTEAVPVASGDAESVGCAPEALGGGVNEPPPARTEEGVAGGE